MTMPKLFEPPFKAFHKSEFSFALAFTISPEASTISKLTTLSQMKPSRDEKKDRPPTNVLAVISANKGRRI